MLHRFRKSCLIVGVPALCLSDMEGFLLLWEMHSERLHEVPKRHLCPLESPKESNVQSAPSGPPLPADSGTSPLSKSLLLDPLMW